MSTLEADAQASVAGASTAQRGQARAPVLVVRDLNIDLKTRRGPVRVVRNVSFTLQPGATMALLGESGAGKSVTARAISAILDPKRFVTSGSIEVNGAEILGLSERRIRARRGEVALIFQDPTRTLNPSMRVGEQIGEAVREATGASNSAARERATELLASVGIADPEHRYLAYPHQLSGGMRQRVVIAIALALKPALLLADEATTSLDVTTQAQIMKLLRDLTEGEQMSLLVITHDIALAASNVDEIMVMYAGRIVEQAASKDLIADPKMPYTRALIAAVPGMAGRRQLPKPIPGSPPDPRALPPGCPFSPRCELVVDACQHEAPPLVDLGAGRRCACWLTGRAQ